MKEKIRKTAANKSTSKYRLNSIRIKTGKKQKKYDIALEYLFQSEKNQLEINDKIKSGRENQKMKKELFDTQNSSIKHFFRLNLKTSNTK